MDRRPSDPAEIFNIMVVGLASAITMSGMVSRGAVCWPYGTQLVWQMTVDPQAL